MCLCVTVFNYHTPINQALRGTILRIIRNIIPESMSLLKQIEAKILNWQKLKDQVSTWQLQGDKVVFTNGCFDLIHYGHLHYLAQARALGDRLVIGLNADASVSRLKGPNRPIKDQQSRQLLLAALVFVDAVSLFEEDTPLQLISTILPDILVKGGDWQTDQIVGADIVMQNGGKVLSLPYLQGYSTTAIEAKIRNSK